MLYSGPLDYNCCISLTLFLLKLRQYFVSTGRELKRLESLSKTPIFVAFADTVHGLVSIRSFGKANEIQRKFENNLDENLKAWYAWLLANRWVGTRLDITSWSILFIVSIGGVLLAKSIDVGMLGFAITYAIQLSGVFQYMVRLSAQVETQMTGVERVMHYVDNLPPEDGILDDPKSLACNSRNASKNDLSTWPATGSIEFLNVSTRYKSDLPPFCTI